MRILCILTVALALASSASSQAVVSTLPYEKDGVRFDRPAGWVMEPRQDGTVAIYPLGAKRGTPAGDFFTHGFFFGSASMPTGADLPTIAEKTFQSLAAASTGVKRAAAAPQDLVTPGVRIRFTNDDPASPTGLERGMFAVVAGSGRFYFWLMFAPDSEWNSYEVLFEQILRGVQISGPVKPQIPEDLLRLVARIESRLRKNHFALPPFRILVSNSQEINAYAKPEEGIVEIPIGIVRFLAANEGELAWVVSHEIAHIFDRQCRRLAPSYRLTLQGQSRLCEERADEFGVQYLIGAGYNPFDAAAVMGRFMMLRGDNSVLSVLVGRMLNTHPVSMDRVQRLRQNVIGVCRTNVVLCRGLDLRVD